MEERHLSKRVILQPSTSFPVNSSSYSYNRTGSATANNEIDAHLFERLQTHPAAVRRRIHAGYTSTAPSFSGSTSSDKEVIFEDEKAFLKRLEDGRAAFARTQSMPVQTRMGEVQPFANSFDTSEWEAKMSLPISTHKKESLLGGGGGEADATQFEPVLLKRARQGAEGQEEQDRDDVLGKWAEEEEGNSSYPSTQDSSSSAVSGSGSGAGEMDTDRRISSLPKRLFATSKTAHASPFVRPQLPAAAATRAPPGGVFQGGGAGSRGPMSRSTAASAPVGSRQMQEYLVRTDASSADPEAPAPWQSVGFDKFTAMEEGF